MSAAEFNQLLLAANLLRDNDKSGILCSIAQLSESETTLGLAYKKWEDAVVAANSAYADVRRILKGRQ